ncbi:E3 ubiquitin-protein ligase HUWE1-like, partial [Neopelma chrysocephalum]|uniref:E3 ubiquitin-protein ligase HUWE1-like n=1 Tax=Neopelma chrysocephalum TaxID=114329 RepID=UPI000FCD1484
MGGDRGGIGWSRAQGGAGLTLKERHRLPTASVASPLPCHPPQSRVPNPVSPLSTAPAKSSKSPAKVPEGGPDPRLAATGLTEAQLQLSVEVLTSHSCSEEGLEDAANVLLQLSRGDAGTRDTVLRLLLSGARQLGGALCRQI